MRVLWASLIGFPPMYKLMGKSAPAGCGWMWASAKALLNHLPSVELGVVVYSYEKEFRKIIVEDIVYYLIPCESMKRTDNKQIRFCRKALQDFTPSIIHLHGTEHSLSLAMCIANDRCVPMVANIQGLASGITPFSDGGLTLFEKISNITPLDFLRGTFLLSTKSAMRSRAKNELKIIKSLTDIIGRTQWDHDQVLSINPNIRYHFMNESLRDSFYESPVWSYTRCKKHTIFVSNSVSPLKGAHQVVRALPIIKRKFQDVLVCFCGPDVMSTEWRKKIHFQGYHVYLRKLIKKLNLESHVCFLGQLSEGQMKQAFLDANVYVMPSSIENSPNSLCEAQILGVPTIASYVGGIPSLVEDGKTGYLYRYEEINMLAQTVIRLFEMTDFYDQSKRERDMALVRHDRSINAKRLEEIYFDVYNVNILNK